MTKYKVVRTYQMGNKKTKDLEEAFADGWEFVRASDFIPLEELESDIFYGYIEYILKKEKRR